MKSRRNQRVRKNKTMKGGCMPEAFVSQPWQPRGEYAKPRSGELIRKLNTDYRTAYHFRDANALANTVNKGPLTDIEVCLRKMQEEIADLQARVPPAPAQAVENENNVANENPI